MAEGGGDGGGVAAPGGAADYQDIVYILVCFFLFGLKLPLGLTRPRAARPDSGPTRVLHWKVPTGKN